MPETEEYPVCAICYKKETEHDSALFYQCNHRFCVSHIIHIHNLRCPTCRSKSVERVVIWKPKINLFTYKNKNTRIDVHFKKTRTHKYPSYIKRSTITETEFLLSDESDDE